MIFQHLPNIITILRILVVPVFVYVTLLGDYKAAFYVFFIASGSDGLDGILARSFGWTTRLGAFLDPIADKLLMVTSYSLMAWIDAIPAWLFIVVVCRDLIIVTGISLVMLLRGRVAVKPFFVSKVNTVLQLVLMLMVLYNLAFAPVHPGAILWMMYAVVVFSVLSVLAYIIAGTMIAIGKRPPEPI